MRRLSAGDVWLCACSHVMMSSSSSRHFRPLIQLNLVSSLSPPHSLLQLTRSSSGSSCTITPMAGEPRRPSPGRRGFLFWGGASCAAESLTSFLFVFQSPTDQARLLGLPLPAVQPQPGRLLTCAGFYRTLNPSSCFSFMHNNVVSFFLHR